ncbi:MAG TPA: TolC family protein [Thermoanaerobaculia bacterium]|nr:TolC family protein [Thermoanaerobaculia bacterium]
MSRSGEGAKDARSVAFVVIAMTAALGVGPAPAAAQQEPASEAGAPLSVDRAIELALAQVSVYQQAVIDERIAAEEVTQARAALLPRARSASTASYNSPVHHPATASDSSLNPSFIAQNAVHEYQELLGVTGELDIAGGLRAALRKNRALLDAAHAGTQIARRALIRGAREAYYGLALATAKRHAAEQSLAAAEEFERVTALNADAGEVPEIDLIRARLLTAARRDDLDQARSGERIAAAGLRLLTGYGREQAIVVEPLDPAPAPQEVEAISADAIRRRPEFAQIEAQKRAAHAEIGIARAERWPHLVYSLDEGFDSNSFAAAEFRQHRGLLATANLDVPLFDWGASRSKQRAAELRAKSVENQTVLLVRDLDQQFYTARDEALTAARRAENARRALADAEKNDTISIARYRAGEAPILEATDAQATLANQRIVMQQALYDFQIARERLREAAGE